MDSWAARARPPVRTETVGDIVEALLLRVLASPPPPLLVESHHRLSAGAFLTLSIQMRAAQGLGGGSRYVAEGDVPDRASKSLECI
jgi:hypothetical protein